MGLETIFKNKKKPTISFEFFPAHDEKSNQKLEKVIDTLIELKPDFVSVTFGAGGSTREGSYELVKKLIHEKKQETIGYIAAYGLSPVTLDSILTGYREMGVQNLFCIRGDKPQDEEGFTPAPDSFSHASDFITHVSKYYPFFVGAAGYPEGHIEAESKEKDLEYLKLKVDRGAKFIISQYCYDTAYFIDFVKKCRAIGIQVPILAGIMPIYSIKMMENLARICGATITDSLRSRLSQLPPDDKEAITRFGIDFAVEQCKELLNFGVDGLHFYTMDKSASIVEIVNRI